MSRARPLPLLLALLLPATPLAQTPDAPPPRVEAGAGGFRLASADGAFALTLGGSLATDLRLYPGDEAGRSADAFVLRRARLVATADLGRWLRFHLEPDFSDAVTGLADAYAEVRPGRVLRLRAGRFKVPFGLETLRSAAAVPFTERAAPSALAPSRDHGVTASADLLDARLTVQAGVFNGVPDGASAGFTEASDGKDAALRVFAAPFGGALRGVGVGVAGTAGVERGSAAQGQLAAYRTSGRWPFARYRPGAFADGGRERVSPQAHAFVGPVGLLGEYVWTRQRVRFVDEPAGGPPVDVTARRVVRAWQVSGSVFLTGEDAGWGRTRPARPVAAGGTGALELAARVHGLALDEPGPFDLPGSATGATAFGVGVNWYPAGPLRLMLSVERTAFREAEGAAPLPAETFVSARALAVF